MESATTRNYSPILRRFNRFKFSITLCARMPFCICFRCYLLRVISWQSVKREWYPDDDSLPYSASRQQAYSEMHDLSFPISEKIHEQELSLPLYPGISDEAVSLVIGACNKNAVCA